GTPWIGATRVCAIRRVSRSAPEIRMVASVLARVALPRSAAEAENATSAGVRSDSDIKPILAVTGLAIEARIAAGPGVEVVCSGCDPARRRRQLDALTPARYRGVISFGVSGALDPALQPGDIVVATEITSDAGAWPMEAMLTGVVTDCLRGVGNTATRAALVGVNAPVMEATNKADLWKRTGAAAVDMESHVAASFGAAAGLPVCAPPPLSAPAVPNLPP